MFSTIRGHPFSMYAQRVEAKHLHMPIVLMMSYLLFFAYKGEGVNFFVKICILVHVLNG